MQVKEQDGIQQKNILENLFTNIDSTNSLIHPQLTVENEVHNRREIHTLQDEPVLDVKIRCTINEPLNEIVPTVRCEKNSQQSVTVERLGGVGAPKETESLEQKITELEDLLNVVVKSVDL